MQYSTLLNEEIKDIKSLQPEGWTDITDAFRFYCDNEYCHPIKVSENGSIAGIGNVILFDETAWLAHIIVSQEFRNKGIGSGIVEYLQREVKSKNIKTTLLIATELGEGVYRKAGFKDVCEYKVLSKNNTNHIQHHSQYIQPYRDEMYDNVIEIDTFISGENREWLLKNYLSTSSYVYAVNGDIQGFYLPNLGEGPILALYPDAGDELMRFKYSSVDKAVIPEENHFGIEVLKGLGFKEIKSNVKRMVFGPDIEWKPEMIYSRIGGNVG